MKARRSVVRASTCIAVIAVIVGCSDSTGTIEAAARTIQITFSTEGAPIDRDQDGYTLIVDDSLPSGTGTQGAIFLKGLTAGTHTLKLTGMAQNCSVNGENPRSVDVGKSSAVAAVSFVVICRPIVGSVRVSVVTTGVEPDPDGYTVFVAQGQGYQIPTNGTVTIPDIRVGQIEVELANLAWNCKQDGDQLRPVQIAFGVTADVAFAVNCVGTGDFQITTRTTGVDRDENGYVVNVSQPSEGVLASVHLPPSGMTDVPHLPPGDYTLGLADVMNNCTPESWHLTPVGIAVGNATSVDFNIDCTAAKQITYTTGSELASQIMLIKSNGTENFRLPSQTGSNADPQWSRDGSRLAFSSNRDGNREIYTTNADGLNVERLTNSLGADYQPAWSPDGRRIAFASDREAGPKIYVMDADGKNAVRLTSDVANDEAPSWSPDGSRIAFQRYTAGLQTIWIMNADGSNAAQMPGSVNGDQQPAWSPDGTKIAFSRGNAPSRNIYVVNVDGSQLTQLSYSLDAVDPAWSPDGAQIAFSATICTGGGGWYYYYEPTCDTQIMLARTDGPVHTSQFLVKGTNPAWRP